MAVTAVYDDQLARVRVSVDGVGAAASVLLERSVDQITWTTVRGGMAMPVVGGVARCDDYEFAAGQENFYRATYPRAITYVGVGAAAHAANAAVIPPLPAGIAAGDLLVVLAATRSSGQGTPAKPAGYAELLDAANLRLFVAPWDGVSGAPTIGFDGGGAATMSVSAQTAAFRNADAVLGAAAGALNPTAQDIAVGALTPQSSNSLLLWLGWKQDDWTSVAPPPAAAAEIGEPSTALGDDQGITWARQIQTVLTELAATQFTVTGGGAAPSRGYAVEIPALTNSQTGSITPVLDQVWIKFVARPYLNTAVEAWGTVDVVRKARHALFDIIGRSLPIAVSQVRGSREFPLRLKVLSAADYERLDLALAGGDTIFLQAPPDHTVPTLYAAVGDVADEQPVPGTHLVTLPIKEVAAPGPDIVGTTATYQTVLDNYASYADVLAAFASYQDVLEQIAEPDEVIVE